LELECNLGDTPISGNFYTATESFYTLGGPPIVSYGATAQVLQVLTVAGVHVGYSNAASVDIFCYVSDVGGGDFVGERSRLVGQVTCADLTP